MKPSFSEFPLLFSSIRYSKWSQLFARLRLKTKRVILSNYTEFFNFGKKPKHQFIYKLNPLLKGCLFPIRYKFAKISHGNITLTFLQVKRTFRLPIDWHLSELNVGTRLWKLNMHYMEFLEELDDKHFISIVNDWIDNNRPYRRDYWLDSWNSYAISIRVVVWMQQLAVRKNLLKNAFMQKVNDSIYEQMLFLENNLETDIGGNHIIKNIKALLWASHYFISKDAHRWNRLGIRLLRKELAIQFNDDGIHFEKSPAYHNQVFVDLIESYHNLDQTEIQLVVKKILRKMAQATVDLTQPDGYISLFNDGGLHMSYSSKDILKVYEILDDLRVEPQKIICYPSSGYYGYRASGNYVLYDCGIVGPDFLMAHSHGDIFSFEWTVDSQRIVVDAGVYEYNTGIWRDYSRKTSSHNTVTIDEMDQCEFWSSFRVGKRAKVRCLNYKTYHDGFSIEGVHDGYMRLTGKPKHKRYFKYRNKEIDIKDTIINGKRQKVVSHLLFNPSCDILENKRELIITTQTQRICVSTNHKWRVTDSWWCPDFGKKIKAKKLQVYYGNAPCEGRIKLRII